VRARELLKPVVGINVSIAVLNLGISLALVRPYGLLGIILGTVISYFVVYAFWIPYAVYLVGIKYSEYTKHVLIPSYTPALLTGTLLFIIKMVIAPTNVIMALGYVVLGLILYYGLFYFISMSEEERSDIIRTVRGLLSPRLF